MGVHQQSGMSTGEAPSSSVSQSANGRFRAKSWSDT
jgi:hypothetical protein